MTTLLSPLVTVFALVAAAVCAAVAWHTVRTARRQTEDRVAALAAAIHDSALFTADHGSGDTAEVPAYQPLQRTPALIACGAAAVATVLLGAVIWSAGTAETPGRDHQPLELARLQHGTTDGALTVSGEVAVPAGPTARGLAVELVTLDRQGRTIASTGAPLASAVAPGARVPFSVSLPYSSDVNRYTIRFRDVSGPRPHVDRRQIQVTRR